MGLKNKDWKSLLEPAPGIDWARVIIHGIFGVVVGAILGLVCWRLLIEKPDSWPEGIWVCALTGAVTVGAAAAILGDTFWKWLGEHL